MVNNKDYPIYYVTYYKDKKLPKEVPVVNAKQKRKDSILYRIPTAIKYPRKLRPIMLVFAI